MTTTVVLGAQWGDEGKGKVTDFFASTADFVVRFQGGNNAGHTIVVGEDKIALSLTPSGVLYSDCIPVIEKSLEKYSAREFVKRLCTGPHSIVKADERGLSFWQRVAEIAKSNTQGKSHLHAALKPWVEETLLNSVLIAQAEKPEIKLASDENIIVNMRKGSAEVNLNKGTSTSKKFTEGNYADFGLADEYMISAAEHVSPYERLKRALID